MMENSIRKETREKFDVLLKNALKKKEKIKISRQQLIQNGDSSSGGEDNEGLIIQEVPVDVHSTNNNRNYILDKFLQDTSLIEAHRQDDENESMSVKSNATFVTSRPVPKPRMKLKNDAAGSRSNPSKSKNETRISDKLKENAKKMNATVSDNDDEDTETSRGTYYIEKSKKQAKKLDSDVDINTKSDSLSSQSRSGISYKSRSDKADKSRRGRDSIGYENELKKTIEGNEQVDGETTYSYEKILAVIVHRTDFLKMQSIVVHPVVKIYLVNAKTGEYLKKTDENRSIVFHYDDKKMSYILPILTQPFDLQKKRAMYPMWEETILVNEDFNYIIKPESTAMVFFELLDFTSVSAANQKGLSCGWHKIAWAFLKIIGKGNALNVGKRARLQLYSPRRSSKSNEKQRHEICEPYIWWSQNKLDKYPSTLYVTLKSMNPQLLLDTFSIKSRRREIRRSSQRNQQTLATDEIQSESDLVNAKKSNSDSLLYKKCQLPNTCWAKLDTCDEGCFVAKFSHDGKHLACSVGSNSAYTIVVYSLNILEEVTHFSGHQGLIHSICWSRDDKFLITASSDTTACIWRMESNMFQQMLPHPAFVYCAEMLPNNLIVLSGCYDRTIRLWSLKSGNHRQSEYCLKQELTEHKGYITCISCNKNGSVAFTTDSLGVIIIWTLEDVVLVKKRILTIIEIQGEIINNVLLHKREKRLLIHARNDTLCLYNLKNGFVAHLLLGNINNRVRTSSCFSNCGTYVFAGSEYNSVNVWNTYTGKLVAIYRPYDGFFTVNLPINSIDSHPIENILCITHYGKPLPILLFKFDNQIQESDKVNLQLINELTSDTGSTLVLKKKATLDPLHFGDILNKMNVMIDSTSN